MLTLGFNNKGLKIGVFFTGICFHEPAETTRTSRTHRSRATAKHPLPLSINQVAMLASLTRAAARPSCVLIRRAVNATSVAVQNNVRHSSKLSQVLRAELEEERQVPYDEGEMPWSSKMLYISYKSSQGVAHWSTAL